MVIKHPNTENKLLTSFGVNFEQQNKISISRLKQIHASFHNGEILLLTDNFKIFEKFNTGQPELSAFIFKSLGLLLEMG